VDETFPRTWEIVSENLKRLRVPGGWLVHNNAHAILRDEDIAVSESMVFLPDEHHTWIFKQK